MVLILLIAVSTIQAQSKIDYDKLNIFYDKFTDKTNYILPLRATCKEDECGKRKEVYVYLTANHKGQNRTKIDPASLTLEVQRFGKEWSFRYEQWLYIIANSKRYEWKMEVRHLETKDRLMVEQAGVDINVKTVQELISSDYWEIKAGTIRFTVTAKELAKTKEFSTILESSGSITKIVDHVHFAAPY